MFAGDLLTDCARSTTRSTRPSARLRGRSRRSLSAFSQHSPFFTSSLSCTLYESQLIVLLRTAPISWCTPLRPSPYLSPCPDLLPPFSFPPHSAIGGGGFFPARVLRTFLKRVSGADGAKRNIPIQAIGLSLYEEVGAFDGSNGLAQEEKIGKEVIRTQWLDFSTLGSRPLVGRRILIVVRPPSSSSFPISPFLPQRLSSTLLTLFSAQDEVDDSRTTLGYAVDELKKDIAAQFAKLPEDKKAEFPKTELAVFVGASLSLSLTLFLSPYLMSCSSGGYDECRISQRTTAHLDPFTQFTTSSRRSALPFRTTFSTSQEMIFPMRGSTTRGSRRSAFYLPSLPFLFSNRRRRPPFRPLPNLQSTSRAALTVPLPFLFPSQHPSSRRNRREATQERRRRFLLRLEPRLSSHLPSSSCRTPPSFSPSPASPARPPPRLVRPPL
jgi:hypothetical protein